MKTIYKLWDKKNECYTSSRQTTRHSVSEFDSESNALNANCHGLYHDTDAYEVHEVEVTYKVSKVMPPKDAHVKQTMATRHREKLQAEYMEKHPNATIFESIVETTIWHEGLI